jgi:aerobic carbon-monoxide dehydrogenase large subunit
MTRRYIGERVPRREDRRFVTGQGQYLDNLRVSGVLHAVVVRSPFAHARIGNVDTASALTVPGVVAAFSGADLRADWPAPLPMMWPLVPDILIPGHWPLAVDEAKFSGDGVAVVVGTSAAAARDGAETVEVDYDPLPAIIDMEAALRDGAPLVHPGFGTNVCYRLEYANGDPEAAFAAADVVVTRRLQVPRVIPTALETRAVLAEPGRRDDFTLWSTTQVPHLLRRFVSGTTGIPEHQLRVVVPDVGGAFGSKLNVYAEEALALALARRLLAPIKWVEERSENPVATTHGRGQIQDFTVAARRDGTLLGVKVSAIASMGAYLQLETPGIPPLGKFLFGGQYAAEGYAYELTSVFTNEPPTGAYRGVGRAEALYGIERMMDHLARELDLDPVEVRRRNYLPKGETVFNAGGIPYDSVDFEPPLDRALELVGYQALRAGQAERVNRSDRAGRLGVGVSSYVDAAGLGPSPVLAFTNYQGGGWESGRVRVLPTGKVEVFSGTMPSGQGHETAWAQLAADALGVPMDDVAVFVGDTAVVPQGTGTFGSRSLSVGGSAIHLAAGRLRDKAMRIAAHLLEAAEADVEFDAGVFSLAGAPERTITLAEVAMAAYHAQNLPPGTEAGLDEQLLWEPANFSYPFGVHVAVVEVDTETGLVRLIRYACVDDCGNVLNPTLVEGQVHGGIAQGVGQALLEEVRYAPDGTQETASFIAYLIPSAVELPSFEVDRTVTPSPVNPLGAKGVAESGTIAAPAAVMNAVMDALAPLGVDDVDMPASPERVWSAIRAARGRGA